MSYKETNPKPRYHDQRETSDQTASKGRKISYKNSTRTLPERGGRIMRTVSNHPRIDNLTYFSKQSRRSSKRPRKLIIDYGADDKVLKELQAKRAKIVNAHMKFESRVNKARDDLAMKKLTEEEFRELKGRISEEKGKVMMEWMKLNAKISKRLDVLKGRDSTKNPYLEDLSRARLFDQPSEVHQSQRTVRTVGSQGQEVSSARCRPLERKPRLYEYQSQPEQRGIFGTSRFPFGEIQLEDRKKRTSGGYFEPGSKFVKPRKAKRVIRRGKGNQGGHRSRKVQSITLRAESKKKKKQIGKSKPTLTLKELIANDPRGNVFSVASHPQREKYKKQVLRYKYSTLNQDQRKDPYFIGNLSKKIDASFLSTKKTRRSNSRALYKNLKRRKRTLKTNQYEDLFAGHKTFTSKKKRQTFKVFNERNVIKFRKRGLRDKYHYLSSRPDVQENDDNDSTDSIVETGKHRTFHSLVKDLKEMGLLGRRSGIKVPKLYTRRRRTKSYSGHRRVKLHFKH